MTMFVIEPTNVGPWVDGLHRAGMSILDHVEAEFTAIAPALSGLVILHSPVGATGDLALRTFTTVERHFDEVSLAVHQDATNPVNGFLYMSAVAGPLRDGGGRQAGRRPPYRQLIPWVRRVLNVPSNQVQRVAWRIARSIGLRGTRGNPYYLDVVRDAEPLLQTVADRIGMDIVGELKKTR